MQYLITYRCESRGREIWGYAISAGPIEFLESTQEFDTEVYFIVNVLPITEEQAKKYDGALRGM